MKWNDLQISNNLKKALASLNYIDMTEIQEKSIPFILENKDVIGMSKTGTGKTGAFLIPLISKINIEEKRPQVLVLTPTRELAIQISSELKKYTKYLASIDSAILCGGQEIKRQAITLRRGVKFVIGTPGRTIDLINKKEFKLDNIKTVVLDEADEMLSMGFEEDIRTIISKLNDNHQTLLFSATINERVKRISKDIQKYPESIKCETVSNSSVADNIDQFGIEVKSKMKNECTFRIIRSIEPNNCVVFCNTKRKVDEVGVFLKKSGLSIEMIHSDIRQSVREKIMRRLKKGELDAIIATDVLARGIDVKEMDLVINYDIPIEKEYYIHRIGRTGRNGEAGKAYTLFTGKEYRLIEDLEDFTKSEIQIVEVPRFKTEGKKNKKKDIVQNDRGYHEVKLSIGSIDGIKAKDIVGAFRTFVGIKTEEIGNITVQNETSIVEVSAEHLEEVVSTFSNGVIKNKKVRIL